MIIVNIVICWEALMLKNSADAVQKHIIIHGGSYAEN